MEGLGLMDDLFWHGKRVLITGHTGFKGGWLSLWLSLKGAIVTGYALKPPTDPSFFAKCRLDQCMTSVIGDIRDFEYLMSVAKQHQPEIVIHMAAQALVRPSYNNPIETYETNVMGTVNLLEVVRQLPGVKAVLIITSDKCYENREWEWGYREIDPMGGYDPYACSKGCAELITASFRNSYFSDSLYHDHGVALASARAGNVIGGGDWAQDRLVPDIWKSIEAGDSVQIRYPGTVRPWQHVLDPLHGYICLVEKLYNDGVEYAEGWNFGPDDSNCQPVLNLLKEFKHILGDRFNWSQDGNQHPHEAKMLKLDSSKARRRISWKPRLDLRTAIAWTIEWYRNSHHDSDIKGVSEKQIRTYEELL
ncbi:MAG: CDP-glucose 4,6-dehydratase [Pseudomonadota bacterium]